MICGSDGILAKPTNDNGKIANGSKETMKPFNKSLPNFTELHTTSYVLGRPKRKMVVGVVFLEK
jgi:hypothetical protein